MFISYTFLFYKNQLYKNKDAQIEPKFKNRLRTVRGSFHVKILRTTRLRYRLRQNFKHNEPEELVVTKFVVVRKTLKSLKHYVKVLLSTTYQKLSVRKRDILIYLIKNIEPRTFRNNNRRNNFKNKLRTFEAQIIDIIKNIEPQRKKIWCL